VVGSVALLWAIVLVTGGGGEVGRTLREPRRAATFLLTTLLISCNWILYIWSVNAGHLLEASLGYFVNPLVNVLLGVVFLKETLDGRQKLAVGLAAVGVAWLVLSYGRFPWISLTLASTFGLYALLRKQARIDAVAGLLVETALLAPAAGAYLVWLWWRGEAHFGTSTGLSLLLLSAGAITAFPLVWFGIGVHRLRLSTMGILQYVAPTLQFLLAVLLYREPFTRAHAVTFAFIWASLALYTGDALAKARRREPAPAVAPLD
jgi:chloramphenicol-sensitive protein RarD